MPVDNLDDSRGGSSLTPEFEESTAETPSPGAPVVEEAATRVEGDANCDPSGGRFSFNPKRRPQARSTCERSRVAAMASMGHFAAGYIVIFRV